MKSVILQINAADDQASVPSQDNTQAPTSDYSPSNAALLVAQLQQAKDLAQELCHALKTSHTLVSALLDGNANDKTIGKYILQTAKETDALLDKRLHKKLLQLLDKSIADVS